MGYQSDNEKAAMLACLAILVTLAIAQTGLIVHVMSENQTQFQQLNQPDAHSGWTCRIFNEHRVCMKEDSYHE